MERLAGHPESLTFSLEGHELQPQRGIFDGDGLVTAQQESGESKIDGRRAGMSSNRSSPMRSKSTCCEPTQ